MRGLVHIFYIRGIILEIKSQVSIPTIDDTGKLHEAVMSKEHESNILGNTSLGLGIASAVLVFGIGLCALTGVTQQWIQMVGTPLFICGGSSAFLGFLGVILGVVGLFSKNRSRATAVVGLILGSAGVCLFFIVLVFVGK